MIRLILCGAAGRMGREIIAAAEPLSDLKIVGGIEESRHPAVGKEIAGIAIGSDLESALAEADCVIDFTNHEAAFDHLKTMVRHPLPVVIGTTGFTRIELAEIKYQADKIPIFMSPNMSRGVNNLYRLVRDTARLLPGFEIEIVETHHRGKKDAPSGTARELARIIKEIRPEMKVIFGREGMIGERPADVLCVNSVRGGDVCGEHRVLFFGDGEFLELRHFATSRQGLAQGTLNAVRFMIGKPAGLYGMNDLMNLDKE